MDGGVDFETDTGEARAAGNGRYRLRSSSDSVLLPTSTSTTSSMSSIDTLFFLLSTDTGDANDGEGVKGAAGGGVCKTGEGVSFEVTDTGLGVVGVVLFDSPLCFFLGLESGTAGAGAADAESFFLRLLCRVRELSELPSSWPGNSEESSISTVLRSSLAFFSFSVSVVALFLAFFAVGFTGVPSSSFFLAKPTIRGRGRQTKK